MIKFSHLFKSLGIVFVIGLINTSLAQTVGQPDNKYVFLNNNFSVGYSLGLNKTKFTLEQGVDVPDAPFGMIRELNFTYTFQLKKHFDLSIRGGLGGFPFVFGAGQKDDPNSAYFLSYFQRMQHVSYFNLMPMLKYGYWLKKKWHLYGGLGVGIRGFASEFGYSVGQIGSDWWSFLYNYGARRKINSQVEVGAERLLKNQNLIGLSVGYNYSFSQVYSGAYELNQNNIISRGSMENSGNYFYMTLNYTFTRAKKWAYIEDVFQTENTSFSDAKRKYKRERRAIDPKSVFIGASGGGSFLRNNVKNDPYIKSSYHSGFRGGLSAEIGLHSNRFLDFGISTGSYSSGFKIKGDAFNVHSSSSLLQVVEVNAGYGLRLINKNGFNFFDVSAGIQVGTHNLSSDLLMFYNQDNTSSYDSFSEPDLTIDISATEKLNSRIFPLVYVKAARNFRIKNYLYFSAAAQYNLGFYPITSKELAYTLSTSPQITENDAVVNLNGTGLQVMFGLKYKFVPKSK